MKKFNIFAVLFAAVMMVVSFTGCVNTENDNIIVGINEPTVIASSAGNFELSAFKVTAEGYTAEATIKKGTTVGTWGGSGLCFGIVYGTKDSPNWGTKYTGVTSVIADGWSKCTMGAGANNEITDFVTASVATKDLKICVKIVGADVYYKVTE